MDTSPVPRTPAHDAGPVRKTCVLVVDDHADALKLLSVALDRWGYEALPAASLSEALTAASTADIDLLLCDIRLPDGSGIDIMRRLPRPVPGVILSGRGSDEDLRQSREAGFAEHLTKPVDLTKLRQVLDRLKLTCPSAS